VWLPDTWGQKQVLHCIIISTAFLSTKWTEHHDQGTKVNCSAVTYFCVTCYCNIQLQKTFVCVLYAFFWVIPRRLNFICRRFGTLCSIFTGGWVWRMTKFENVGVFIREKVWLGNSQFLFSSQTFSRINTPTFSNLVILHTHPPMKMEQSVPKRRHIKFRRGGITQKKAYNIQNTEKFWDQEYSCAYLR